ncbi:fatty acid desaturase [Parvularcula sp. IMCC14364]|uniref:fatty acid desaturase n=1 Tax=Parvularcula sp. IMCC14364 TaxID=3067902 RepID=UPI00274031D8|nr:fatty acid desaturase [Parvularcula sp. IMCC14364]
MSVTAPADKRHMDAALEKSDLKASLYLGGAFAFYILSLLVTLSDAPIWVRVLACMVHTITLSVLFTIGHDCVHNAFFRTRFWNRWGGRFAFGFLLHSTSLWKQVHNINHHGRTNLKGVDDVWAPFSPEEFRTLPGWRQWLERVYRGPFGHLIYYQSQYLLPKVILPIWGETRIHWRKHVFDSGFVVFFCAGLILLTLGLKALVNPQGSLWVALLLASVIPFIIWNALLSFTIYVQHTNPGVHWFDRLDDWSHHNAHIRGTVDTILPTGVIPLYAEVMRHTAHHDNPTTPIYALPVAQERLNALHTDDITRFRVNWPEYWQIVRACKLYDYRKRCWTDFDGQPTSPTYFERFNMPADPA